VVYIFSTKSYHTKGKVTWDPKNFISLNLKHLVQNMSIHSGQLLMRRFKYAFVI